MPLLPLYLRKTLFFQLVRFQTSTFTIMKLHPVPSPEFAGAGGFTHLLELDFSDFTSVTTTNARTFNLPVTAGTAVYGLGLSLVTAFKNLDTDFISVLVKIGDGSDDDAFLTSTQVCERGTEVTYKAHPTTVPYVFTADGNIVVTVTPTTDKALSNLTEGKAVFGLVMRDLAEQARNFR